MKIEDNGFEVFVCPRRKVVQVEHTYEVEGGLEVCKVTELDKYQLIFLLDEIERLESNQ